MSNRKMSLDDVVLPVARSRSNRAETSEPVKTATVTDTPLADTVSPSVEEVSSLESEADQVIAPEKPVQRAKPNGSGIRALRMHKKDTSGAQFNLNLDEPLKERLERASFENKVPQAVIVRAAIADFLKKDGY